MTETGAKKILSAVLIFIIMAGVVFNNDVAEAGPGKIPAETSLAQPDKFVSLWNERLKLEAAGKTTEADEKIKRMTLERLNRGIANLHSFAAALVAESVRLRSLGKSAEAYVLLSQAEHLAPDFYGIYSAEWRFGLSDGLIFDAFGSAIDGAKKKYSNFNTAFPAFYNSLYVLITVYHWLVFVFALFLLARYLKLIAHDFQERIPGFDVRGSMVMAGAVALFPVAFIPNLILYSFLLILLLWIYSSPAEKIVAAILAVTLLAFPLFYRIIGNGLAAQSEPVFSSVVNLREGVWDVNDLAVLEKAATDEDAVAVRDNVLISLAKALAYNGKYGEAVEKLNMVEIDRENSALVSLLKGNIHYMWEKYPESLGWYEKAVKDMPESPIVHFNLAMVLNRPEIVDLSADSVNRAEVEIGRVKELAPDMLEIWTGYQELAPGRFVVDMQIPSAKIWKDVLTVTPDRNEFKNAAFNTISNGVGMDITIYSAVVIILLMIVLTFLEKILPHSKECAMCGKPICPICNSHSARKDVCVTCMSIFEARTGLDPRTRERARAEIRLKKDQRVLMAEILSIILPGSGHLLLGKTVRGIVFALISFTFIFGFVFKNGVMRSEWFVPGISSLLIILSLCFLYIVFIGITVWNASAQK